MIKRYIKILIGLIAAAVIAIGAYIGVSVHKKNELKKMAEDELKKIIFDFNADNTAAVIIHNESGDFKVDRTAEGGWNVSEGGSFPVNNDKMNSIAASLGELTADRILSEDGNTDSSEYGFDGKMIVGVALKDGSEYSVEIGDQIPGDVKYYVRVPDSDTIYIVSEEVTGNIKAEMSDIKDNFLFNAASTDDITYLKYIEDGTIVYDIRKENDEWKLFTPFPQGVVNGAGVTNITSMIIRAQCSAFIDEELTDLSKFGFDNPKYQLEIKTDYLEAEVIFGNYYDDSQQYIYAYNKNLDQIYIFETAYLGFAGTSVEDILYNRLRSEFFGNINSLDMNLFGTEYKIDYGYSVAGEGETNYLLNGEKINNEDEETLEIFNNLINSITGLCFDKVCENVPEEELSKEPDATITYKLKEGEDYRIDLIIKSDEDDMMYILEDGKYNSTLMKKAAIDSGVLKYIKELKAVME